MMKLIVYNNYDKDVVTMNIFTSNDGRISFGPLYAYKTL